MPATFTATALVLNKTASGENGLIFHLLDRERGGLSAYRRLSRKGPVRNLPDLFDRGTLQLEPAKQGDLHFLQDYQLEHRREGIGRSYQSLENASRWCRIIQRNLAHAEHCAPLYNLTEHALDKWNEGAPPQFVLLKSLFRLARDEGYPVRQHWLAQRPASLRQAADIILHTPLAKLSDESFHRCDELCQSLLHWLENETDILV